MRAGRPSAGCFAAGAGDLNLAGFGCGGFGLAGHRIAGRASSFRLSAADVTDRSRAGCDLSAARFAGAGVVDRSVADRSGAAFPSLLAAAAAMARCSPAWSD